MRKFTLFISMALVAMSIYAAELTVADGTATSEKLPVNSYYSDVYVHNQIIYPAQAIKDMKGGTISALEFYVTSPASKSLDAIYEVSLAVVEDDHFTASWSGEYNYSEAQLTKVYEGTLDANQATVTFTFSTPFEYADGNLLLDIQTKTAGSTYADAVFAGEEGEDGAATVEIHGHGYSSLPSHATGGSAFLPKTTFTYTEGTMDVENTEIGKARSVKRVENGQLVVIKNGVKYNALGSVID